MFLDFLVYISLLFVLDLLYHVLVLRLLFGGYGELPSMLPKKVVSFEIMTLT